VNSTPVAVLFDFGGVLSTSPFEGFSRFERANDLPPGFIRHLNSTNPDGNAWAAMERGEVDLEGFAERFEKEATDAGYSIDARALLTTLSGELRPEMLKAAELCHRRLKTGLLTNNFAHHRGDPAYEAVVQHFDVVVESSRVGCRKPEPRFYQLACDLLGIVPREAVFLDDLGVNLKPARAMGMRTIKVSDPSIALAELEAIVGFSLRS
jgi:putative hydrolase of the HAD superfamily